MAVTGDYATTFASADFCSDAPYADGGCFFYIEDHLVKLLLLGDSAVGKSLTRRPDQAQGSSAHVHRQHGRGHRC